MKRLILEQSNDELYTSHSDLVLVGACINRYSDLGRQAGRLAGSSGQIAEIDILRSYLGLLHGGLVPGGRTATRQPARLG